MDPISFASGPYSLPTLTQSTQASNSLNWLIQPYQLNSGGNLPGTTVINVGNVISVDGNNDYITVSDPSTHIRQLVMGKLPDGTFGLVTSITGVDVLTVFS